MVNFTALSCTGLIYDKSSSSAQCRERNCKEALAKRQNVMASIQNNAEVAELVVAVFESDTSNQLTEERLSGNNRRSCFPETVLSIVICVQDNLKGMLCPCRLLEERQIAGE